MKRNLFTAISLALTVALSLGVAAQDKPKLNSNLVIKLPPIVNLPCQITHGGDVASDVRVTNTSGGTIPSGTKITVAIPHPSGSGAGTRVNLIETSFLNGSTKNLSGPAAHTNTCTAWFTKN